jgi:TolB-like protein
LRIVTDGDRIADRQESREETKVKIRIVACALLCVSAGAFAALPKVAVLDAVLPSSIEKSVSIGVTEKISEELVNSGRYTVLDRTTVGQSLKEIEFQMSGLVNDSDIKKAGDQLGSRLGASYVVVAQVTKMGGTYFISAKLIDVKTGEIVAQASDEGQGDVAVNLRIAQAVGRRLASGTREPAQAAQASPASSAPAQPTQAPTASAAPKNPWGRLAGIWMVDPAKRPTGWGDHKYVFADDGRLQIYHLTNGVIMLVYQGQMLYIGDKLVTTKDEFNLNPKGNPELVTDYSFITDSRVKIGWGGVFYIEMTR